MLLSITNTTDQELLQRLAQGDRLAFDLIYTRHWYPLFQSAYHIFREEQACMDIVQDVFVWLWEKRTEVKVHTSLPAYLATAVKFKTANYIRSGKVRQSFFDEALRAVEQGRGTVDEIETRELKNILQHSISALPDKCREIFRLSRNEHLSNQEIAQQLGISVKTVEAQMTIALRRIRHAVDQYMAYLLVFFITFCL